MTTFCPYRTLGVRKTASADAIYRAYRKKSKQHHPDRNPGDDAAKQAFEAVDRAYRLLSDPERRARYDRDGDTAEPRPQAAADPAHAEIVQTLQPLLLEVIQAAGPEGVKTTHIVNKLTVRVLGLIRGAEEHRAACERGRVTLTEVAARLSVRTGDNVLGDVLRVQLANLERDLAHVRADLDRFVRVKAHLTECGYRTDGGKAPSQDSPALLLSSGFLYGVS